MEISWLGHSCFLIKTSLGKRIITDPYLLKGDVFESQISVVTISHNHFDHNYTDAFKEDTKIFNDYGTFSYEDIIITGIPSYHDNVNGNKRGKNIIYLIEVEGIRICHLGDLGHFLTQDYLGRIGLLDVLFIPVGGNYTLNGKEASKVAKFLNSKITIPMHYKTPDINFNIKGVEEFLIHMDNVKEIKSSSFLLQDVISNESKVLLLTHPYFEFRHP